MQTVDDFSFGVVPLLKKNGVWRIFLIQHKHAMHWALPKGHPEEGESDLKTAERELNEETGLSIVEWLKVDPLSETYQFRHQGKNFNKTVTYFPAIVSEEYWLCQDEVEDGNWFTKDEAIDRVTFSQARGIIKTVMESL